MSRIKDIMNKAKSSSLTVNIPTYGGASGELDIGGMIRNVAQGATFAFSDEIEALVKSAFGDNYEQELNTIRQEMKAYTEANPKAALTQELLGGVITGSGLLKAANILPKTNNDKIIINDLKNKYGLYNCNIFVNYRINSGVDVKSIFTILGYCKNKVCLSTKAELGSNPKRHSLPTSIYLQ